METSFGWVLAGTAHCNASLLQEVSHHVSTLSGDDKFWEVEEFANPRSLLTSEEQIVVTHFQDTHQVDEEGRFIVPLPRKSGVKPIGESRSQAVRRFLSLERSLCSKKHFQEFSDVIREYFDMDHAELVPAADLQKPCRDMFYLPMHAVLKESSTTTKMRAVFDASAKSTSGISLDDQLRVGPTVHSTLIDVLLRFRLHRVVLSTDVSRMYRAIVLPCEDRDLHRFVWRERTDEPLRDYRMTRVTFGVSSSSFAANMAVKQNALNHTREFPLAAAAVVKSFYVDDGLCGADTKEEAVQLQQQLQSLFSRGGFLLRKWRSNEPSVLQYLPPHLLDVQSSQQLPDSEEFAKTLGIEWSNKLNCFRLAIAKLPPLELVTKRSLISDVAKTFDILGWFAPAIILIKILLQQLWEENIGWDDSVPVHVLEVWERWRKELPVLADHFIPRCYFPSRADFVMKQLHGFS